MCLPWPPRGCFRSRQIDDWWKCFWVVLKRRSPCSVIYTAIGRLASGMLQDYDAGSLACQNFCSSCRIHRVTCPLWPHNLFRDIYQKQNGAKHPSQPDQHTLAQFSAWEMLRDTVRVHADVWLQRNNEHMAHSHTTITNLKYHTVLHQQSWYVVVRQIDLNPLHATTVIAEQLLFWSESIHLFHPL